MKDHDRENKESTRNADDVFLDALEFEVVEEREAFLEIACKEDPALRREVDLLFSSLAAADKFFGDAAQLEISVKDLVDTLTNNPAFNSNATSIPPLDQTLP